MYTALQIVNGEVMKKRLSPAKLVIARFADAGCDAKQLARDLNMSESAARVWAHRNRIPGNQNAPLLSLAKRKGVRLTSDELIFGGFA